MLDFILTVAPWIILAAAPVALFGVLCAINRICIRVTRKRIAAAYLLIAWGWGCVIFALLDYLVHSTPLFWPLLLIVGVMLLALGNAGLFFADRRENCTICVRQRGACP